MSTEPIERHEAVVIGAGPAGLAMAAMLRREGVDALVLERESIGASWRNFYERLHLHTIRWLSALPGLPIDRREGRWVSREGVIAYLERYARYHRLDVRESTEVRGLERDNGGWVVETAHGPISARFVVVATGFNRDPYLPDWAGRDGFAGELIHSLDYRNAAPYRGKDVLVVGTGNSGAEIAVDLVEGGARNVMISVRTPPNILRRDVAGFPSQLTGVLARQLPVPVADRISLVMQRLTVGDLSPYGLPPPRVGVVTRVNRDSVPILDVGLIDLVKKRRVEVVPAVESFEGPDVVLAGGRRIRPDAVIAATGFRHGLERLVGRFGLIGTSGRPVVHGPRTHPNGPNLYFIGFTNPISGNLREVGIDARRIARAVSRVRRTERQTSGVAATP
ncbi:MAG: NAD(P)/FAD-dependent oxidoreductase [Actinomycetota bacterium]|nr:NAD(P)/FAD-dependent oxidoreductase [Actinomycetota bacterium]